MPKKKITLDDLARMINDGFDATKAELNKRFDSVEKRLSLVETTAEDIKLRMSEVAYRFELRQLERRMEILERKAGGPATGNDEISYDRI